MLKVLCIATTCWRTRHWLDITIKYSCKRLQIIEPNFYCTTD